MQYKNKYNLPQSLVDVIKNHTYDLSESDPKRIGVTTLINPPIQRLLMVRHWNELSEDVSDHIWRITGNAYHYILSKAKGKDRLIEEKLTEEIDGITIVGKLDLYEDKNKSIEDWKVTSLWSIKMGDKEDWARQLNAYAWLLRKANFEVKEAYINAILRDWRRGETLRYDDYPPIPFKRVAVKLWSFEEQDKYIRERIKLYKEVMDLPDDKLPICSASERWSKPDTWAVYKGKNKTATRVVNSQKEALEYSTKNKVPNYRIEERKGGNMKCEQYCILNSFCPFYQANYDLKTGKLKNDKI